jgi:hypothetical protein
MTEKMIILQSDEIIVCPKCANKFPVGQGVARQTIEQYETDFNRALER